MVSLVLCLILFVAGTIRAEVPEEVSYNELPVEVDDFAILNSTLNSRFEISAPDRKEINFSKFFLKLAPSKLTLVDCQNRNHYLFTQIHETLSIQIEMEL